MYVPFVESDLLLCMYRLCTNFCGIKLCEISSRACVMTKMVFKITGVIEKHCSTFAFLSNCSHPQTEEVKSMKN